MFKQFWSALWPRGSSVPALVGVGGVDTGELLPPVLLLPKGFFNISLRADDLDFKDVKSVLFCLKKIITI